MSYHVRLEQFEGPLELLLHLIEKEKLDITRVSLAHVADQYLEHLGRERGLPLSHLAEFLSIASRLLLLKSRALLPLLHFTEEEEESMDDLEHQLREYKHFREAALTLGKLLEVPQGSFVRESFLGTTAFFYPPEKLTAQDLRKAFVSVLGEIPVYEKLEEEALEAIVTLEEKILHVRESLKKRLQTSFREITESVESRVEIIVSFLALLELVKQRFVHVEQTEFFGDIHIHRMQ